MEGGGNYGKASQHEEKRSRNLRRLVRGSYVFFIPLATSETSLSKYEHAPHITSTTSREQATSKGKEHTCAHLGVCVRVCALMSLPVSDLCIVCVCVRCE